MCTDNEVNQYCYRRVAEVVNAMQVVYYTRLLDTMKSFIGELPIPEPQPDDRIPLALVSEEVNALHQLETLRAKYERRVHVDPEDREAIAGLCRKTAEIIEPSRKQMKQMKIDSSEIFSTT